MSKTEMWHLKGGSSPLGMYWFSPMVLIYGKPTQFWKWPFKLLGWRGWLPQYCPEGVSPFLACSAFCIASRACECFNASQGSSKCTTYLSTVTDGVTVQIDWPWYGLSSTLGLGLYTWYRLSSTLGLGLYTVSVNCVSNFIMEDKWCAWHSGRSNPSTGYLQWGTADTVVKVSSAGNPELSDVLEQIRISPCMLHLLPGMSFWFLLP